MHTITDMIAGLEADLASVHDKLRREKAEVKAIIDRADDEGRKSFSDDEDRRSSELLASIEAGKAEAKKIRVKLDNARAIALEDEEGDRLARDVRDSGVSSPKRGTAILSVGRNPRTYSQGTDPDGTAFARDVARAAIFGDSEAHQRLSRHMAEERVERGPGAFRAAGDAISSTSVGMVVPQYLVDLAAPKVAARRPFASAGMSRHVLPAEGMSLEIPLAQTATSVAPQTSELSSVSATSLTTDVLTIPVRTYAGQQTISRQAIERGRLEPFIMTDLQARYATALDSAILNVATNGLDAVAQGFASTDGTFANVYPKVLAGQAAIEAALLGDVADFVVMHSRRWASLSAELGSTWPLINGGQPAQASGVSTNAAYGNAVRGRLPNGLLVIVDNNIVTDLGTGTNEDAIYVVSSAECHLWEDAGAPVYIRAEQPAAGSLGVLLVVYGYAAFTFERYANAQAKVTGLTPPTF